MVVIGPLRMAKSQQVYAMRPDAKLMKSISNMQWGWKLIGVGSKGDARAHVIPAARRKTGTAPC